MIWNCVLKDTLIARARAGDAEAFRMLIGALPADMPASVRNSVRDERIRALAIWLTGAISDIRPDRVARILAAAGAQLEAGHRELHGDMMQDLTTAERGWLFAGISDVQRWAR